MTSYTSDIVVSFAIVVALGVGAYIGKKMEEKSDIVVDSAIIATLGVGAYRMTRPTPMQQAASALHAKAWGKPWPQSEGTISKTEISGESGSVDDDDDVDDALADKLEGLKSALGASRQPDFEDVLVVREEFEMLRQALEDHRKKYRRAIVVTGHPGIGKTTFLFYLLLYRLERKLPTAVQLDADYYFIFDEQGAIVHSLPHRDPRLAKCWALTDSNENIFQPCAAFQSLAELVVLASLPKPEWKPWIKQNYGSCIISDLPSVPGIAAIVKELRKRQIQLEKRFLYDPSSTLSLVRKWGPSTRNIIRSMNCAAVGLNDPIIREAKVDAMHICRNPSAIYEESLDIMPRSDVSSVIFLRRTRNGNVTSDQGKHFIPTPHLLALFEEQRREMANKESLGLFCALSSHALTRSPASWAHENLTHERLGTGGKPLSIFRGAIQKTMQPSTRLLPGTLDGLKEAGITDSFYWIPSVANFPGVDGVLGDTDGHVYIIQATIASVHTDPIEGIKKVWKHFRLEVQTGRTWHFVFTADKNQTASEYAEEFPMEYTIGRARVQVWVCAL